MHFTHRETRDLLFAGLLISLAFAILYSDGIRGLMFFDSRFFLIFIMAFFTAGIGFILHELMHKYVAQNYHLSAEFFAFYPMLWLALAFSLFGFIVAAPGAVMISGYLNKERNGKISLAGPATNLVLAIIFLIPLLLISDESLLGVFVRQGFLINSLLALFNMIPAMPFDGAKVMAWNKTVYYAFTILAFLLFVSAFFL